MCCLTCSLLLLTATGFVAAQYEVPIILDEHCNGTAYIPCPSWAQGRAGSVEVVGAPRGSCGVVLALQENCQFHPGMTFSMYINVRCLNSTGLRRTLRIKLSDPIKPNTPLKEYYYGTEKNNFEFNNSPQMDQLLITASNQPKVLISLYSRYLGVPIARNGTILDYVILYNNISALGTTFQRCPALKGYMPEELICDTRSNRLNCPADYQYSATSLNPGRIPAYCNGHPICIGLPQGGRESGVALGQGPVAALVIGPVAITFVMLALFWVRRLLNQRNGYRMTPTAEDLFVLHTPTETADFVISGKDNSACSLDLPPSYSSLDLSVPFNRPDLASIT